jgi:hypothetical protein
MMFLPLPRNTVVRGVDCMQKTRIYGINAALWLRASAFLGGLVQRGEDGFSWRGS